LKVFLKMKRTITATALVLTLSGCSTIEPLEVFSRPIEKTPLNLNDPEKIELDNVKWRVITEQNAKEIFKKLKDKNIDPVLIGLTDNDYEKLSLNMNKIRNYIIQYQYILREYRKYYEDNVDAGKKSGP
jgi:PBP1b-binding outer membrane lipoprotein LpoB